jgi:hypothetical protein
LKVVVSGLVAINPHVVRITTHTVDDNDEYRYYELAVPLSDFTENDAEGNIGINGDKLQELISERIIASRNVSNLAAYLETLGLEWELVINDVVKEAEDAQIEGKSLAYGNE